MFVTQLQLKCFTILKHLALLTRNGFVCCKIEIMVMFKFILRFFLFCKFQISCNYTLFTLATGELLCDKNAGAWVSMVSLKSFFFKVTMQNMLAVLDWFSILFSSGHFFGLAHKRCSVYYSPPMLGT